MTQCAFRLRTPWLYRFTGLRDLGTLSAASRDGETPAGVGGDLLRSTQNSCGDCDQGKNTLTFVVPAEVSQ